MGIICPLSPEVRVINSKNHELQKIVKDQLDGLQQYGFSKWVVKAINQMSPRFMYNEGILEDIEKLHNYVRLSNQTENSISESLEQELQNSCLILQNQFEPQGDKEGQFQGLENLDSFQNNIKNNKSLVGIINIIYKQEIKVQQYSLALQMFLKWASMFQAHAFGGFMKPLYKSVYDNLKLIKMTQFTSIVDELCVFVQFMVGVITEIYGLKVLAASDNGKIIKNENVYNLVMSYLFKRTKIKRFLLDCINNNQFDKIELLKRKLLQFGKRPTYFFGIGKKFLLHDSSMTQSQINKSIQTKNYTLPYQQSLKLVDQLCKSGSPVTKLKIIVAVSKRIVKDIQEYYDSKQKEVPDLDPDNLSSIVMYLLARTGNWHIYEQLKIVEHFTTSNCLNCISGFYLKVFDAAIESILDLKQNS